MRVPKALVLNATGVLALLVTLGTAAAKTPPDLTPKIDSPDFWKANAIVFAEVDTQSDDKRLRSHIVERYTGPSDRKLPTEFDVKDVWMEPHPNEFESPTHLEGYDDVLISYPEGGDKGTVVVYKMPGIELTESCRLIASIRAMPDLAEALQVAHTASDATAERFVLSELLAADLAGPAGKAGALVRAIRANPQLDVKTRVLANEVVQRLSAAQRLPADDWQWNASVLRNETDHGSRYWSDFCEQCVTSHPGERAAMIDLVCELVGDENRPMALRAGILTTGDLDRLAQGPADEAGNQRLIELALARLKDPSPLVRSAAGGFLWHAMHVLHFGERTKWEPVADRTIQGLKAAAAATTEERQRLGFETYVAYIEAMKRGE